MESYLMVYFDAKRTGFILLWSKRLYRHFKHLLQKRDLLWNSTIAAVINEKRKFTRITGHTEHHYYPETLKSSQKHYMDIISCEVFVRNSSRRSSIASILAGSAISTLKHRN